MIRDFNRAQGDKIEISAHTAEVQSIEYKDSNGDGKNDYSVITVISQQGNAGAHDEDLLGTITVYGNLVKQSDIAVTQTVYGAYELVDELGAGVHFEIEDDGVLPDGGSDGGHHDGVTDGEACAPASRERQVTHDHGQGPPPGPCPPASGADLFAIGRWSPLDGSPLGIYHVARMSAAMLCGNFEHPRMVFAHPSYAYAANPL